MASKAIHAAWVRSTSCGVEWICTEMDAPASVITLGSILCTSFPYARPVPYIRRTLAGEGGGTETDQGFYRSWLHHPRPSAMHKRAK